VLTTFFIMGFGYFVAVTALDRPLPGKPCAWAAWMALVGVFMAVIPILMGRAQFVIFDRQFPVTFRSAQITPHTTPLVFPFLARRTCGTISLWKVPPPALTLEKSFYAEIRKRRFLTSIRRK
jgi:cytochrome c oxidase subunit 1